MRAPRSELPITIEGVSLRSGRVTILESVSLVLAPGAPTVLIGPNGSGKSSLLRLATGLVSPTIGRVTWGGRVSTGCDRCAIVFQRPVMLRRSVAANVAFALRYEAKGRRHRADRIAALLDLVGLAALAARPARRLSGGEQQRLALARALARDPEILFLDEPTANLDPAATNPPPRRRGRVHAPRPGARKRTREVVFLRSGYSGSGSLPQWRPRDLKRLRHFHRHARACREYPPFLRMAIWMRSYAILDETFAAECST